jgi:hypothetical protein
MGHDIWADVVPFAAQNVAYFPNAKLETLKDDIIKLLSPEAYVEASWLDEDAFNTRGTVKITDVRSHGWHYQANYGTNIGKQGLLWGWVWAKDDHKVWVVNESAYSNVGDYDMTVCGHDAASVQTFLDDWGLQGRVEEAIAIKQSG